MFSAFIKEALAIIEPNSPGDYLSTRVEVMSVFPELRKTAIDWKSVGEYATHAADIAGLGILARPTIQKMRGKEVSEGSEHAHELAGLGMLAVPSAIHLGHKLLTRGSTHA